MQKLSVVISAFNEEEKIEKCLRSVEFADEIVVINNDSSDKTSELARKYTSSVYSQKNDPLLIDLQKNIGFKKAKYEFILSIDADEVVSEELKKEIQNILKGNKFKVGYFIPRKNIIFGKQIEHSGWYPDHQLRLFRKGKGEFKNDHVHEGIQVDGETEYLKEHIVHYNYESVLQFIQKNMITYAQNEANGLINKNYTLRPEDLIKIPTREFLSRFFARKGYKDGIHGLFLSLLMASSHLVVLALVWEKQGFKEVNNPNFLKEVVGELKKVQKDTNYWIHSVYIDETKNLIKKIHYKIRRKL